MVKPISVFQRVGETPNFTEGCRQQRSPTLSRIDIFVPQNMENMMENEKSKQVSNEELLADIELTGRELEAYQKISDGFRTLAVLPENAGVNARLHNFQADKYRGLENECAEFLRQLHALKAERGL